jgi:hypothetical protein
MRLAALALALLVAAAPARAGDDCHCDCYFGFDCEGGQFCDWGSSFTIEDGCWWRTPKPDGAVGAGCNQDYGTYGQCDGKCAPLSAAAPASVVGSESPARLRQGVALWGQAFTDAARAGGGPPTRDAIARIDAIGFDDPSVSYALWRMVVEVMILARGPSFIVFPEADAFSLWDVAAADLRDDPVALRNGDVVMRALIAEMLEAGRGRPVLERIDAAGLDAGLYALICGGLEGSGLDCLHERLAVIAAVLRGTEPGGGEAGPAAGGVQPTCPGCHADIVASDAVDIEDLLELLAAWLATGHPADLDGSGVVGIGDLVDLLSHWGACAPS